MSPIIARELMHDDPVQRTSRTGITGATMGLLLESDLERLAACVGDAHKATMLQEKKALHPGEQFDVFLSHNHQDRDLILGLRLLLEQVGLSVQVDWLGNVQLRHGEVIKEEAKRIRQRLRQYRSLLYVHVQDAPDGRLMPWELGFMDASTGGRCAIVPIVRTPAPSGFCGLGFLGLFPYLGVTGSDLCIHTNPHTSVAVRSWIDGANPSAQAGGHRLHLSGAPNRSPAHPFQASP